MEKLAESGNANAQFMLGSVLYRGTGFSRSVNEAAKWIRKAADQENVEACFLLGVCYCDGSGVLQDYVKAISWWEKAAANGHEKAKTYLTALHSDYWDYDNFTVPHRLRT
jgi:TPR repeat protein